MKPLIILEMANNHMGDTAHGEAIVRAFGAVVRRYADAFRFAFKLQYRDLDSFIHPAYKGRADVKYVKRFEETRLPDEAFRRLLAVMRDEGFELVCTPFDEVSVGRIAEHGIDTIKVASCSFTDWPLLERIAAAGRPVIASTAGSSLDEIDNVTSFFLHRGVDLTIMHCVGEYPTAPEKLAIAQVALLKSRYPGVRVGFSTHEPPDNTEAVGLALALGAEACEKHVGLPTEQFPLNAYSVSPQQLELWLAAAARALAMLGPRERYTPSAAEREGLFALRRGVFARRALPAGSVLSADDVFFAFPTSPGQLTANDWSKYTRYTLNAAVGAEQPVMAADTGAEQLRARVLAIVEAVKRLLREGNVVVPGKSELEISHHYGLDAFDRYGLTMVTVVNREYCKKLLVMLPGQIHPEQYHKEKEETFVLLHGEMTLRLDGVAQTVKPGDVVTVERGVRHEFHTEHGVVFEEISSTHYQNDSFYTDASIGANPNRKTRLTYWM